MIRAFWHVLSDPVSSAYEKLQLAQRKLAFHVGERAYHAAMTEFYHGQATSLDPDTHWWEFAHAKQKWADHEEDRTKHSNLARAAEAAVDARMAQYLQAKQDHA